MGVQGAERSRDPTPALARAGGLVAKLKVPRRWHRLPAQPFPPQELCLEPACALSLAKSKMKGGVGEAGEAPCWVGDSRWRSVQEGRFLAGVLPGDGSEVVAELGAALSDPAGSVGTAPARSAAAKGRAGMHKVALAAAPGQISQSVAHGAHHHHLNSAPRRNAPGTRLCRREPCPKAAGDPKVGAVLPPARGG